VLPVAPEQVHGALIRPVRKRIRSNVADGADDERIRVVVDDVRVELLEANARQVAAAGSRAPDEPGHVWLHEPDPDAALVEQRNPVLGRDQIKVLWR
jgi:hypothetical protein